MVQCRVVEWSNTGWPNGPIQGGPKYVYIFTNLLLLPQIKIFKFFHKHVVIRWKFYAMIHLSDSKLFFNLILTFNDKLNTNKLTFNVTVAQAHTKIN